MDTPTVQGRRAADAAISKHGGLVIADLETLIREAVRDSDDARVKALDAVLRRVELILQSAAPRRAAR